MEYLLQENVPKLLPTWQDLSVQDFMQIKSNKRYFQDKLPDFGGAGIDIENSENKHKLYVGKTIANEIGFSAHICSLPFFPPNKVSLKSDPCLVPVNAANVKLKKFCSTLELLRRCANNRDGKFKEKLLSSYTIAKSIFRNISKKPKKFCVPDKIIQLATECPQSHQLLIQEANFDYLGGCLTSSQTAEGHYILLHPVGRKLNELGVTPLVDNYDCDKAFHPDHSEMKRVKLSGNCIQKISAAFPGHCFVQQDIVCQYVNFSNPSSMYAKQLSGEHGYYVNIAASPYNPTEYVSIDKYGVLKLQNVDESETIWTSDRIRNSKVLRYSKWKSCTFGSHPKSLLSLLEDSVYIYDSRLNAKSGSILLSKHFSTFPEEKFLNLKHLADINPFQHLISSTHHLYVCDERYLKKPVLIWSHLFKSFPMYCDVACYDIKNSSSDAVALLGSQESRELSLFALRCSETQIQPTSLCSPLLLSSTSDFIDSLKLHCIYVNNHLTERMMNPLVGVCAVPHSNKSGFTAFQLNSLGDVFYQDFDSVLPNNAEHTYRVGAGCVLSPPDKILPRISEWTDFASRSVKEDLFSRSNLVSVQVDLSDLICNSPISSGCNLCNNNPYSCDREVISTTTCPSCGLDNKEVEKILEAYNNLGLLAGPVTEQPEIDYFEGISFDFNDEFSAKLLKPWSNEEVVPTTSSYVGVDSDSNLSYDSSKSRPCHYSIRKFSDPFNTTQYSDMSISKSPHALTHDETTQDFLSSQNSVEDYVPPSQEFRPVIGETLRSTPKRRKIQLKNTSMAGF